MRKQDYGQIIAGSLKGRKIRFRTSKQLRPTRRMVREAIFSALFSHLGSFEGIRVLDAYCGSGLLGLEFLSRGAAFVDFVDSDHGNLALFKKNTAPFGKMIVDQFQYWHGTVSWFLKFMKVDDKWDVVWFDPPFAVVPEAELASILGSSRARFVGVHLDKNKAKVYDLLFGQYACVYTPIYCKTFGQSVIRLLGLKEGSEG